VSAEEAPRLRPYMWLAELLGGFAGQVTESALCAVRIEYEGQACALNTRPVTAAVLNGLLAPLLENVNIINAPIVAHQRGIKVSEIRHDRPSDYQTLVRLTVQTENQTREVAGTLFGGDKPRVVAIKGIRLEAELGSHMLYVENADQPGFIGALGSVLADAGINIATFHLGRTGPGGDAISLIEVDQQVAGPLLDAVCALPHVNRAKALVF